ncbi:hypothetical protein NpPPO83_00000259 [Neofusicoccum parvum]|uniref:Uncharacterized protein n=1 Tax=Neofusicoccum parvum TaxID=310453 RepID=A0ACB5SE57_9PEZI|nr:hypothetical protein NpPPO83_00000259 [Neofusicoccum parvum]
MRFSAIFSVVLASASFVMAVPVGVSTHVEYYQSSTTNVVQCKDCEYCRQDSDSCAIAECKPEVQGLC